MQRALLAVLLIAGTITSPARAVTSETLGGGDAPNSCAAARAITQAVQDVHEQPIIGSLGGADTSDFYNFYAEAGNVMTVTLKPDELIDGANFDLHMYQPTVPGQYANCSNAYHASRSEFTGARSLPEVLLRDPVEISGTYVIEIRLVSGSSDYYVNLENVDPLPNIPNNDALTGADASNACATASLVAVGAYQGSLSDVPSMDLDDWYRIQLSVGQDLTVAMKPSEFSDFDLTLFSPTCSQVADDDMTFNGYGRTVPEVAHLTALSAGMYRVHIARTSTSGAGNYLMSVAVSP